MTKHKTIALWEQWMLRYVIFPRNMARLSQKDIHEWFLDSGKKILKLYRTWEMGQRSNKIKILRFKGLEESSTYWSPADVLEHLVIVGQGVLCIIHGLNAEEVVPIRIKTSEVKPQGKLSPCEAEQKFEQLLDDFAALLMPLDKSLQRCRHPWLGMLNNQEWYAMMALHQALHLKQLKIMSKL